MIEPTELKNNLKAALLAVSEDTTRPGQNSILLESNGETLRFVATNGHWLWINEIRASGPVFSFLLRRDSAEEIARKIKVPAKKDFLDPRFNVQITPDENRMIFAQSNRFDYCALPTDGVFPPYRQVLPSSVTPRDEAIIQAPVSSAYMSTIGEAFDLVGSTKENAASVSVTPSGGEYDPLVFVSDKAPDALAILMPVRGTVASPQNLLNRYRSESKAKAA